MSCRDWESRIALFVEGDLGDPERQALESHLNGCATCWDLAEDLRESQAMFKSIRQDVADEEMLSSVRSRVLADVAAWESGNWVERFLFGGMRRKAALAGLALMIGGAALWVTHSSAPPVEAPQPVALRNPEPAIAPVQPDPEPVATPVRRSPALKRPVHHPKTQPPPAREEPAQQVTIKLLTDDPNVIIYWLVDEKGD